MPRAHIPNYPWYTHTGPPHNQPITVSIRSPWERSRSADPLGPASRPPGINNSTSPIRVGCRSLPYRCRPRTLFSFDAYKTNRHYTPRPSAVGWPVEWGTEIAACRIVRTARRIYLFVPNYDTKRVKKRGLAVFFCGRTVPCCWRLQ